MYIHCQGSFFFVSDRILMSMLHLTDYSCLFICNADKRVNVYLHYRINVTPFEVGCRL